MHCTNLFSSWLQWAGHMDLGITNDQKKVYRLQELLAYDVGLHYATNGGGGNCEGLVRYTALPIQSQEKGYHFERLIYWNWRRSPRKIHLSGTSFLEGSDLPNWMKISSLKLTSWNVSAIEYEIGFEVIPGDSLWNQECGCEAIRWYGPDGLWMSVQDGSSTLSRWNENSTLPTFGGHKPRTNDKPTWTWCIWHEFGKIRPKFKKIHQEFSWGCFMECGEIISIRRWKKQDKQKRTQSYCNSQKRTCPLLLVESFDSIFKHLYQKESIPLDEVESICNVDLNDLSKLIRDSRLFEFIQSICK